MLAGFVNYAPWQLGLETQPVAAVQLPMHQERADPSMQGIPVRSALAELRRRSSGECRAIGLRAGVHQGGHRIGSDAPMRNCERGSWAPWQHLRYCCKKMLPQ